LTELSGKARMELLWTYSFDDQMRSGDESLNADVAVASRAAARTE
jgi:hypothetical protein